MYIKDNNVSSNKIDIPSHNKFEMKVFSKTNASYNDLGRKTTTTNKKIKIEWVELLIFCICVLLVLVIPVYIIKGEDPMEIFNSMLNTIRNIL